MEPNSPMPESRKNTENERTAEAEQPAAADTAAAPEPEPPDERVWAALHAAGEKKALDLVVLDLRQVAQFTDFFLIASGTNVRQVQAIADAVVEDLRKKHQARPARVEGYNAAEWVLVDYGDFILHVFEDKARRFYDLERLWRDAARVPLTEENTNQADDSSLRSE